ncbi:hypothetical protein BgiMline_026194, partial [Biomphalaria glabrata]
MAYVAPYHLLLLYFLSLSALCAGDVSAMTTAPTCPHDNDGSEFRQTKPTIPAPLTIRVLK